jgi:glyoxylase-like metal-dependent hydrolase (beta-lactamase superfamily II)
VLATASGNVAVQVGDEGMLFVDTAEPAQDVLSAARRLSEKPIRWIVNTHFHPDHTGANETFSRAGRATPQNQFGSGRNFPGVLAAGATIVAHEAVLNRMAAAGEDARPQSAWPTLTYFGAGRELFFNGEGIEIIHVPRAHTDGDSLVYFRRSDVVATGDIFSTIGFPRIDLKSGGTIDGVIAGLNRVLDIAIPKDKQEGGTFVIPGHGRVSDEADVVQYRNMVTIIRDRVREMKGRGMTLEQVKAARPTAGYDRRWATPVWTADMFVEAVYQTVLSASATTSR